MTESSAADDGSLEIDTDPDGRTVLTLSGEIDLNTVGQFAEQIDAALKPGDRIAFNLGNVTFMDTSGIALVLDAVNSVADAEIRAPSRQVRRVLEASGLTSVLRIVP